MGGAGGGETGPCTSSSIAAKPQRISLTQKGRLKYAFGSEASSPVITATTNSEFSTASFIAASLLSTMSTSNHTLKPHSLKPAAIFVASIDARSERCVYETMQCHFPGALRGSALGVRRGGMTPLRREPRRNGSACFCCRCSRLTYNSPQMQMAAARATLPMARPIVMGEPSSDIRL